MPEDHIKELRDVAFRKIGRNLVNFQLFERALKLIIVEAIFEGTHQSWLRFLRDKAKDTDRKALGWLVEDFFKTVYSSHPSKIVRQLNSTGMDVVSVRIESNKDSIRDRRRQLREIVKERNLLVHRLLANFDPESAESCENLIRQLDEQVGRRFSTSPSCASLETCKEQQKIMNQLEAELREAARKEEMPSNQALQSPKRWSKIDVGFYIRLMGCLFEL